MIYDFTCPFSVKHDVTLETLLHNYQYLKTHGLFVPQLTKYDPSHIRTLFEPKNSMFRLNLKISLVGHFGVTVFGN